MAAVKTMALEDKFRPTSAIVEEVNTFEYNIVKCRGAANLVKSWLFKLLTCVPFSYMENIYMFYNYNI